MDDPTKLPKELAEAIAEIEKVEKRFLPDVLKGIVHLKDIENAEIRFTFKESKAIARAFLELRAENERLDRALEEIEKRSEGCACCDVQEMATIARKAREGK